MTSISTDRKTPVPDPGQQFNQQRRPRRRRSIRWMISHYLDRIMRSRQLFNVGLILLLIAGFIHISLVNGVLGPKETTSSYSYKSEPSTVANYSFIKPDAATMKLTSFYRDPSGKGAEANPSLVTPQTVSTTPLANPWATGDLRSIRLLPAQADDESANSDTTLYELSDKKTATYVVNEGGSLWRAGKLFLDDEVLLDKLIDNLAQSGMDVRSVSAGAAFTVNDLGNDGMLVTLDNNGDTYEAHIIGDGVTTLVPSLN